MLQNKTFESLDCNVKVNGRFWAGYQALVRDTVIPYQWEALNDRVEGAEPSHAIKNLKIAAGLTQGEYHGFVFQDSDLAKWLEAAAYSLETCPDAMLEQNVDSAVELLGQAQQSDGYLNSYFTVKEPGGRWTNLYECHELYCAGHMIEAAVAYFRATGKRQFLDIMCRFADYIAQVFGPGPGQVRGYCGHEEIELALVKLYRATGEKKYLDLAVYFINERGCEPFYFDIEWEKRGKTSYWTGGVIPKPSLRAIYYQAHRPVREQEDAVGHAVRAVYLYTAMADIARETGDESLHSACVKLWRSIVARRMYITGGIGSMHEDEAFSLDYDLPNDTVYAETCASIGLIFFARKMLSLELKGEYADTMERALYNTVLAGMAQDGKTFFYVNPLEVWPDASEKNLGKRHVLPRRPPWFACACCPPNVARLIASLGQYIYTTTSNTIGVNLFIGSELDVRLDSGNARIVQRADSPYDGSVSIEIAGATGSEFTIAVRIPGWCRDAKLDINGRPVALDAVTNDGYAYLSRAWQPGDTIGLKLPMMPMRMRANPAVRADAGKVAVQCGPFVYCLEECDNGAQLQQIVLPKASELMLEYDASLFGGANVITAQGLRQSGEGWDGMLYKPEAVSEYAPAKHKFIPYYLWANREPGEMTVWVREG